MRVTRGHAVLSHHLSFGGLVSAQQTGKCSPARGRRTVDIQGGQWPPGSRAGFEHRTHATSLGWEGGLRCEHTETARGWRNRLRLVIQDQSLKSYHALPWGARLHDGPSPPPCSHHLKPGARKMAQPSCPGPVGAFEALASGAWMGAEVLSIFFFSIFLLC